MTEEPQLPGPEKRRNTALLILKIVGAAILIAVGILVVLIGLIIGYCTLVRP